MRRLVFALLLIASLWSADRKVDPTFLRRHIPNVEARTSDVSTPGCKYKPVFGAGDPDAGIVRGVVRFGEISVAAGGSCNPVTYPAEEQVYVITEGNGLVRYGDERAGVKKNDFLYLAPGVRHSVTAETPMRLFVMGFKVPGAAPGPSKLQIANLDEINKQVLGSHPDSVRYQLMMGDVNSKRDRIAAARVLTSLYVMEFEPGGTNFPHHHDAEEEIYVLLDGTGEMVAGSGMDGVEARFPAKPGDAYFFRLNCTVGFYAGKAGPARMLAVRSLYPRRQ